jgi:uncharacterized YccA/Bax inhibitor family protein
MENPAFTNSPAFSPDAALRVAQKGTTGAVVLDRARLAEFIAPAEDDPAERMSYEDTIRKAGIAFLAMLAAAAIAWTVPQVTIPALIAAFVLSMINAARPTPSRVLILSYAAAEGLFVGGISSTFSRIWDGIVPIAVFGTFAVIGVTLLLFLNGKVRTSPRATRIFFAALVGYLGFSLVNLALIVTGVTDSMFGLRDLAIGPVPLGVPLGILVVVLGAYSLVMVFEQIQYGVETRQRRIHGWTGAFGIVVTVVWLYLEILRLLTWFSPRND